MFEKNKLSTKDLSDYYVALRKKQFESGRRMHGIYLRKAIHPIIKLLLKIDQVLSKDKIKLLHDARRRTKSPLIFACTHCGGNDIQRALQAANKSAYLMLGNPGLLYKYFSYKLLELNGVISLETFNKTDRKIAYARSIELLNRWGNLLIFPEGAWNVSPNVFVMRLFSGTVRMARETGAEIVPIAVEQYESTFIINIGENYRIKEDSKSIDELTDELRTKLATLKWEIYESIPKLSHTAIPEDYLIVFQQEIIDRCDPRYGFTLEDAKKECFHNKASYEYEAYLHHMDFIQPKRENAFLFNKRLKWE